ncbi:MAG: glucose-1-phosphate adenylyltransferase [Anaerolineales bacterium]|nr:glucose-1-phosphate adenylyltransferase [Anaerolineales bacterium]
MKTRVVILAGGEGSRLGVLTAKRAKPAVPFAGKYRIIDFALSNCVNSGLFDIMILTQYRPHSLMDHIGVGRPWDLDRSFTGGVRIFQPYKGRADTDWYAGTADAIQQNFTFLKEGRPDYALVLGGDHIYQMNYERLINFHEQNKADLTIASLRVSMEEATRMGILATDADYRVTQFVEKPKNPPGTLASMGIYVFNLDVLDRMLYEDTQRANSAHDFGKDIIPRMVAEGMRVFAYPFTGYWVDVGTIDAYWLAHMDLIRFPPVLDLNDREWIIHTRSEERPPVLIQNGATVRDSLITDGSIVAAGAIVERSVLSPGVYVGPQAVVRESIILTDSSIEAGAVVERVIADKNVTIGHNAHVGRLDPAATDLGITTLGKSTQVPGGLTIGRSVVIGSNMLPEDYPGSDVADGARIEKLPFGKKQS